MKAADILLNFRNMSPTVREQGKLFEKFIRQFLRCSKSHSNLTDVWMWADFPFRGTQTDTGIDLVAKTDTDEYWAIQCKFYDENSQIAKSDIDSFVSASAMTFLDETKTKRKFSFRLVFATADLSSNAIETLEKLDVPASVCYINDLDDTGIDWEMFWNNFDKRIISGNADNLSSTVQEPPKQIRPHQEAALQDVLHGFETHDRGKLIMACGTGKTYTALKIAESMVGADGFMLYLVPSLSLLAQTLKAWTVDSSIPIRPILVCSDREIHEQDARRKEALKDDEITGSTLDLAQPATTNSEMLAKQYNQIKSNKNKDRMTVVFSTYQSIDVIARVQKADKIPSFDLIVCDEAHRTTGVTLTGGDESAFVRVHDNQYISAHKRLYMTATPRFYGDTAKKTAKESDAILCSMDDETLYGPEFHRLGFGKAVELDLLTDYRVIVLTINEDYTRNLTKELLLGIGDDESDDGDIPIDDVSKIFGCWKGLCKKSHYMLPDGTMTTDFSFDPAPMKRAVAFCSTIKNSRDKITPAFEQITAKAAESDKMDCSLHVEMKHVDGSFGANKRKELLDWLKSEPEEGQCKILSNVRCLSEGVDVPSLDAVLFLSPRNSQVDVVQSLGRVMRKSPEKKYGYIVLPVAIPSGKRADEVLNDNKRYKVVWQVLRALRAHDERFNVWINQLQFKDSVKPGDNPVIFGEPTALKQDDQGIETLEHIETQQFLGFDFNESQKAIIARVVQKCGDRAYLEEWAKDIARIAAGQIEQIEEKLKNPTPNQKKAFDAFLLRLQNEINPSVDHDQAIEMLTQHMVTKPVFDALFSDYSFVKNNVVSQAIQTVLDEFQPKESEDEKRRLAEFHQEIGYRIAGIQTAEGKQNVITNLYDQFFKTAFPKMAEKLGIVYTPIEVVDFIIHSVEYVLKEKFRRRLSNKTVHVLDPFTGTGTFIVRLLQSGLIDAKDFKRKYTEELHANEIVLLAYYIAAINIEETIHSQLAIQNKEDNRYEPFPGIVLTDTFQMNERPLSYDTNKDCDDLAKVENNERIVRQRRAPIEVIIGNPPYSVGQGSANDNNQNQKYPILDSRVEATYVAGSKSTNKNSLYDTYIKAFRWASDRIEKKGVIAFVSNGGWIDGNAMDCFRKSLAEEFSDIYIFNLRGNQRTSGELSRKEGGKIFGSGSRAPIAITILVKSEVNTNSKQATIHYFDIGDYLTREEKLTKIKEFSSIAQIDWIELEPNKYYDWINQRGDEFLTFYALGEKRKGETNENMIKVFSPVYTRGCETSRDAWCYNFSRSMVKHNINKMIDYYNQRLNDYIDSIESNVNSDPRMFMDLDSTKISWSSSLVSSFNKKSFVQYNSKKIYRSLYRPYTQMNLYFGEKIIHRPGNFSILFPSPNTKNLVVCISGIGANKDFSALITDIIPCLDMIEKSQCFPLYYYTPAEKDEENYQRKEEETSANAEHYQRHDAVTDAFLKEVKTKYGIEGITKDDIFYYVYGIFHSMEYREKYATDVKKSLARIPLVKSYADFDSFSRAGRRLAEIHLNYDSPKKLSTALRQISQGGKGGFAYSHVPVQVIGGNQDIEPKFLYRVDKMKFAKQGKVVDKTRIIYNEYITIDEIPLEAYDYIVNGKSAIEWIMERYAVSTDNTSGIINDPNLWDESNPRYIIDLIQSVITVSINTVRIIKGLPKLVL